MMNKILRGWAISKLSPNSKPRPGRIKTARAKNFSVV
jgi:hypothetical protein